MHTLCCNWSHRSVCFESDEYLCLLNDHELWIRHQSPKQVLALKCLRLNIGDASCDRACAQIGAVSTSKMDACGYSRGAELNSLLVNCLPSITNSVRQRETKKTKKPKTPKKQTSKIQFYILSSEWKICPNKNFIWLLTKRFKDLRDMWNRFMSTFLCEKEWCELLSRLLELSDE